jgi:DNA modification methylase
MIDSNKTNTYKLICGDCLEVLPTLAKAKMIFADPPDNLGVKYEGFVDRWQNSSEYTKWLCKCILTALNQCDIFWLSYYYKWDFWLKGHLFEYASLMNGLGFHFFNNIMPYVWWYTFGQHNPKDCGSSFRPLLRFVKNGTELYPDAIREPSARQREYNDKRAHPDGRVPGTVWEGIWQESRVCGTFKEKRKWHKNQHPEALVERMIKLSCKPGDLVIDMFAGTGTVLRVCQRLHIDCISIEISKFYCEKIAEETGLNIENY